jgi:hypothetical protein
MLFLNTTTRKLQLTTSSAAAIDVVADYVDLTSSAYTPGVAVTAISSATTTDVVAAPAASTTRQIKSLTATNKSTTTANKLTFLLDDNGTDYTRYVTTLPAGYMVVYTDADGWRVTDTTGRQVNSTAESAPIDGFVRNVFKVGATSEAGGILHTLALGAGTPGAWAPGTPGMAGRATDGTTSSDLGCIPLTTPASGNNYLVSYTASGTTAHAFALLDVLWVQSGITVTTTTAQTVNSVTWPARDDDGATAGKGVQVGILVSAATGNAGAITNTTLTYTASDGTGSRTGTMASFPATGTLGTIVPFALQGSDIGVQSVQSVTLGTTYTSGTIHLIAYRILAMTPAASANLATAASLGRGVKLWAGATLLTGYIQSTTTATNLTAVATFEVR